MAIEDISKGNNMLCLPVHSIAQFKLDRTNIQHGLDTTLFSFACVQSCMRTQD